MTSLFALNQSWRWGYIIFAISQLLLLLCFAFTRNHWQMGASDTGEVTPETTAPPISQSIRQPLVLLSILLFFVFTGTETIAGNWGFTLLTEARGVDEIAAGQWISLYWWSFTLGRIVFGFIADRMPIIPTIRACLLLVLTGGALLTINLNNIISLIGLLLIGFALAPVFPLLITETPRRLGSHATNAIGFQIGAAGLSLTALPAVAGVLASATSLEIIGPYLMTFALLALICFQILNAQTAKE
jgi:fucose permease